VIVGVFDIDDELDIVWVPIGVNEFIIDVDIVGDELLVLVDVTVLVIVEVRIDVLLELIELVFDTDPVDVFDFKLLAVFDGDIVFVAVAEELDVKLDVDDIDDDIVIVFVLLLVTFILSDILPVNVFVLDNIPVLVDVGVVVVVIVYIPVLDNVTVPILVLVINNDKVIDTEAVDVFDPKLDFVFVIVVFIVGVWTILKVDVLVVNPVLDTDGLGDDVFVLVIVLVPDPELVPVLEEVTVAVDVNVFLIVLVINDDLDIVGLAELVLDLADDAVKEGLALLVFEEAIVLDNVGDDDGVLDTLELEELVFVEVIVLLEVDDPVYVLLDVKLSVCFGEADDVLLLAPDWVT